MLITILLVILAPLAQNDKVGPLRPFLGDKDFSGGLGTTSYSNKQSSLSMKWITLSSIIFLLTACDKISSGEVCTEIGCESSFRVSFNAENDARSLGDYTVLFKQDGMPELSCAFTLAQTGLVCETEDCITNRLCDLSHPDNSSFLQGVFYSSGEEQVDIYLPRLEESIQITITQDGNVLSSLRTTPTYEIFRPNGPDCPPACLKAESGITVQRP